MIVGLLNAAIVLLATIAISVDLGILDIPIYIPHAASPVGTFEPLPAVKYTGQYTITAPLTATNTERLLVDVIQGPEHLVYRSAAVSNGWTQTVANEGQLPGYMWISSTNGTIFRIAVSRDASLRADTLEQVVFAGPGRVLGFAFDRDGGMYLCNSLQLPDTGASIQYVQGLMHWSKTSGLRLVANRVSKTSKLAPGRVLSYTNSVAVSPTTGKVYFTNSGDIPPPYNRGVYDTKAASGMIALTNHREGLLLEFDPKSGETRGLVDGLYFANGVDVAADGSYLVFAETFTNMVFKLWLSGPKAGTIEDLVGPLPAFVDNVLRVYGTEDSYFVGFPASASKLLTRKASKSKILRAIMSYLPATLRYSFAPKVGGGVRFSGSGDVEEMIVDSKGTDVSSTPAGIFLQSDDKDLLFMGSLENDFITVAEIPT